MVNLSLIHNKYSMVNLSLICNKYSMVNLSIICNKYSMVNLSLIRNKHSMVNLSLICNKYSMVSLSLIRPHQLARYQALHPVTHYSSRTELQPPLSSRTPYQSDKNLSSQIFKS